MSTHFRGLRTPSARHHGIAFQLPSAFRVSRVLEATVLVLLCLVGRTAHADEDPAVAISCGTSLTPYLAADKTDTYQFTAATGDAVAIDVIALAPDDWKLRMRLFGPDNPELGVDDADTCSGRIQQRELEGGSYILKVSACDDEEHSGQYALTLSATSARFNGLSNCGSDLPSGTVHLPPGTVDAYKIAVPHENLTVNVTTTPPGSAPLEIRIFSPDGELLKDSCNGQAVTEVGAGVQTILVNTCIGAAGVDYLIAVSPPARLPTPTPTRTPTPSPTSTTTPRATATNTPPPAPACAGDCNGDGSVTIDEILLAVNIALGSQSGSTCLPADTNHDGNVTIDEILTAISNALNRCPGR